MHEYTKQLESYSLQYVKVVIPPWLLRFLSIAMHLVAISYILQSVRTGLVMVLCNQRGKVNAREVDS